MRRVASTQGGGSSYRYGIVEAGIEAPRPRGGGGRDAECVCVGRSVGRSTVLGLEHCSPSEYGELEGRSERRFQNVGKL